MSGPTIHITLSVLNRYLSSRMLTNYFLFYKCGKQEIQKSSRSIIRARRLIKKVDRQGRSKRGGEAYSGPYVEPLIAARTPAVNFFNSLLNRRRRVAWQW